MTYSLLKRWRNGNVARLRFMLILGKRQLCSRDRITLHRTVTRILWNLPIKTHAFATLFSSHRQSTLFKRVVSRVVFSMSKALHHRCISWDNIFGQNYTKMYKREKRSNFQGIGGFGAKKKDGTSARASKSKCDWLANHSTTKDKTNGTNPPDTTRHHTPSHL